MLSAEEKAYCRALEALRRKDYLSADKEFEACRSLFANNRGRQIITEAARLMVEVGREKRERENIKQFIEEASTNGKETNICGQGQQEE